MNGITKSKSTKLLSALLAVLMIVAMLPTTVFAWSVEEGTKCTSTYGDHYVGSDGEMFYSKPTTTAIFYNDDGSFYVKTYSSGNAKYKYMMIDIAITGLTTFVISVAGVKIGNLFGSRYQSKAELVGGLVLIGIGLKILLEGLGLFG